MGKIKQTILLVQIIYKHAHLYNIFIWNIQIIFLIYLEYSFLFVDKDGRTTVKPYTEIWYQIKVILIQNVSSVSFLWPHWV